MVHFSKHKFPNRVTCQAKMQNGSSKTGRGVTVNGTNKQQKAKITSTRQERGSCSSTASCPVFSGRQNDEGLPPRSPSSLSSPMLHGSGSVSSLRGSVSSLQGSSQTVKGSVSSLKSSQSSNVSLHSASSSEDDSWDTNSWSSGATCLLRSSIRQHSEEVFRVRASSESRLDGTSDSENVYQYSDSCKESAVGSESLEGAERGAVSRTDSEHSLTSSHGTSAASTVSADFEEKIEAKLKFSQFLDEVTCRVLDPECLQAFGAVRQRESLVDRPQTSVTSGADSPQFRDPWDNFTPSCKILDSGDTLRRKQEELPFMDMSCRPYLETDIDQVRREHEINSSPTREMEKGTSHPRVDSSHRVEESKRSPVYKKRSDGAPRPPQRSTSLSRALDNKDTAEDVEDVCGISSVQEENDELHRRLIYTSHQLHTLEKEFDSSCQYLETELQHTQDELDKFTEKLHRIQSSYTTLQRINQELQDEIQRMTKLHEEERRSLNREILVLKNHLIDADITIHQLQEDNVLYRRDCKLAAQLLQCGKSPNKPSEVNPTRTHKHIHFGFDHPAALQGCAISHVEKCVGGMNACHSDSAPTTIIDKVQENPEPVNRSSSPHADKLQQRKSCDLYRSDTALYCRGEQWPERRQSVDLDNTEDDTFHLNFSPFCGFTLGSLPVTGSYSSFNTTSEEKPYPTSSQQLWLEGQNSFGYEKDGSGFPKSNSFQHGFPVSCYREPYRLPEDDPSERWRQTSVEDVKTSSLHSSGPVSSFSCSEPHFTPPTSTYIKPSYSISSIPERDAHTTSPSFSGTAPDVIRSRFQRSRNPEHRQQTQDRNVKKDYISETSVEALNQTLEAPDVKHCKKDLQKRTVEYVNPGLSRKDSLTKAQLYGTLLN
ncbi:Brain-enriched guanylate kinase-associated protein [Triplophysa tibetana]|uniref:Brain-enriched guanylate kinase-associated protein n=1 Tax=Triplophysa tibetana TaxID=1572043 RepID=A0A5A9NNK7_9TELE|nr:Brain-enriched guanylate kinase-associated protein [Triplophysa tibetana]